MSEREEKREQWRELLKLKAESGQTIKAFCDEWDVPVHSYHYWRQRLAESVEESAFVTLGFSTGQDGQSGLELDLRRLSVRLERDFDEKVLQRVLAATAPFRC
jgi:hypothetical protein